MTTRDAIAQALVIRTMSMIEGLTRLRKTMFSPRHVMGVISTEDQPRPKTDRLFLSLHCFDLGSIIRGLFRKLFNRYAVFLAPCSQLYACNFPRAF